MVSFKAMYKIKQIPEDFVVNEVSSVTYSKGEYGYFLLKKRNYSTQTAVERIADFLNIPLKFIGYAGNKDRQGVTTQMISIKGPFERAKKFKAKDLELEFKGNGNQPISLGDLEGNKFEIIVRNITKAPKKIKKFINYFDEQRFSKNNAAIGKALVKKDFKKAIELLTESSGDYERDVENHYNTTHDAIGSIRRIPKKIINLYIHAYQSEIWNQAAEKLSKIVKKNVELPLVGFGTEIKDEKIKKVIEAIMKQEGIGYRDFIIRSMPEISSEGNSRKLYAEVKKLTIGELEDDELNNKMKKVKISFFLYKGCYATMAIKNMFKER